LNFFKQAFTVQSTDKQQLPNEQFSFWMSPSKRSYMEVESSIVTPVQTKNQQQMKHVTLVADNNFQQPMETLVATSTSQQISEFQPFVTPSGDSDNDDNADDINITSPDLLENYPGHQQQYACMLPASQQCNTPLGTPTENFSADKSQQHAQATIPNGTLDFASKQLPSARLARMTPYAHEIMNDASVNIQHESSLSNQSFLPEHAPTCEYALQGTSAKDYRKMVTRIFVNKKLFAKVKFITNTTDLIYRGTVICLCSHAGERILFMQLRIKCGFFYCWYCHVTSN
jgi:hypothetical protein